MNRISYHVKVKAVVMISLLLLLTPLVQGVDAARVERETISLAPELSKYGIDPNTEVNNAYNHRPDQTMINIIERNNYSAKGMYWGHGMPTYLIDYGHVGYGLNFSVTYEFTSQDIQLGCLGFWVWIPVDGTDVSRFAIYNGSNDTASDYLFYANNSQYNDHLIFDEQGIFVYLLYELVPGIHMFRFALFPKPSHSIKVYLSNEIYGWDTGYNYFRWREIYTPSKNRVEYYGNIKEDPPGTPPVSFIFVQGRDRAGYSSIEIEPTKIIYKTLWVNSTHNATYPSIYIPFRSDEPVTFAISYSIRGGYHTTRWGFTNPTNPASHTNITNATYEDVNDFLLVSAPWYMNNNSFPAATESENMSIVIQIIVNRPITLFMRGGGTYYYGNIKNFYDSRTILYWIDNTGVAPIRRYYEEQSLYYPQADMILYPARYDLFMVVMASNGVWAKVYEYAYNEKIDSGFAWGYRYPGSTRIHIGWNTGREYYFNGSVYDYVRSIETDVLSSAEVWNAALEGFITWLTDDYVKNTYGLGEDIMSGGDEVIKFVWEFLKTVWRILEEAFGYLTSIARILPWVIAITFLQAGMYSVVNRSGIREELATLSTAAKKGVQRGIQPIKRYYNRKTAKAIERRHRAERRAAEHERRVR